MRMFAKALVMAAGLAVAGCASSGGTGQGFMLGAFAGNRSAASTPAASALIAALNGGIIDETVNARLDKGARQEALQAEYQALEYSVAGEPVQWTGAGDQVRGEVVPSQPYRVGSQNCRQYTHTVFVLEDPAAVSRGTACRSPNGIWTPLT